MTYSKNNQIRKYVQGYGFISFARYFGSKYGKKILNKGFSTSTRIKDSSSKFNQSKYGQALKKQGTEFGKIASKKIIQKSAEATGDLIGSKIANKITSGNILHSSKVKEKPQEAIEEEIIIPSHQREKIINDLRLL